VTEQSQHYPWLCLGICFGGDFCASDFDTITPLGDRSFELSTQDYLEQLDAIAMPCSNRLHRWIWCGPQCAEKSQCHSDFEIPKWVFGAAGTLIINHNR
jgi:hypothetical protein